MQHENLWQKMQEIKSELTRMLDNDPVGCFEPRTDPRFMKLLEEAVATQKELDIIMRGTFHDRPEELFKWEQRMQSIRESDAEGFLDALRAEEEERNQF